MNAVALTIAVVAVGVNGASAAWHIRMRRRADATWRDAADAAQLAYLQARVLGQCRELLCEDCRRVTHGHYMATVAPAFDAFREQHR